MIARNSKASSGVAATDGQVESIRLVARNGEAVRQALERGEFTHLDTASGEITDAFLPFAIKSGLLKQWAESFPDSGDRQPL